MDMLITLLRHRYYIFPHSHFIVVFFCSPSLLVSLCFSKKWSVVSGHLLAAETKSKPGREKKKNSCLPCVLLEAKEENGWFVLPSVWVSKLKAHITQIRLARNRIWTSKIHNLINAKKRELVFIHANSMHMGLDYLKETFHLLGSFSSLPPFHASEQTELF